MSELPDSSQPSPKLRFIMPDGSTREVTLNKPEIKIGRSLENDLVLEHPSISRKHARLRVESSRIVLEDLGSANGTFFNEQRLPPASSVELTPGQALKFGHVMVGYELPPAFLPAPGVGGAGMETGMPQPALATPQKEVPAKKGQVKLFSRWSWPVIALAGGTAVVVVGLLCGGALAAINYLRGTREKKIEFCNQPPMQLFQQGGLYYQLSALQTAVPNVQAEALPTPVLATDVEEEIKPIADLAFLELPFPYDGGNEKFGGTNEQFLLASQYNVGQGGRINSWFDHYLPLYPAPKDPGSPGGDEDPEPPVGKNLLPWDGILDPYRSYSGHPGLDFSVSEYQQPTTPVFAAADGVVEFVGVHGASGALYVKLKHTVVGVGEFITIYWHLHPDDWFEHMKDQVGQFITAGTRIGTMGNTGYSTGHHLHFEVRFDNDGNGEFPMGEVVDPYGWVPSERFFEDPWLRSARIVSNYLWIHPLGTVMEVPETGGGQVSQPVGTGGELPPPNLCVQPNVLPPGGKVYFSWAPDPDPSDTGVGTGNGCLLSVTDTQGQPIESFKEPLTITLTFTDQSIADVDPDTLTIYWLEPGQTEWKPLKTELDLENGYAVAQTDKPGKCALIGQPTRDIIPPRTVIEVAGVQSSDHSFYDEVVVTLKSSDSSGIKEIIYSLDNGSTWQTYVSPFSLQPSGQPQPVVMDGQFFGGLPGTFLILASSLDNAGNREDPPVYYYFSIDPSKNPITATPTPTPTRTRTPTPKAGTATPTPTSTPTPTLTPTPTEAVCAVQITLTQNANCRYGPSQVFEIYTSYTQGTVLDVDGYNDDLGALWYYVKILNQSTGHCWISALSVTASSDTSCLEEILSPPTPTPTPADTTPPPAPIPRFPLAEHYFKCGENVYLSWDAVQDASGIAYYEWVVEKYNYSSYDYTVAASGQTQATSVDVQLDCANNYLWYVRAVDGRGNIGPYSDPEYFTVGE